MYYAQLVEPGGYAPFSSSPSTHKRVDTARQRYSGVSLPLSLSLARLIEAGRAQHAAQVCSVLVPHSVDTIMERASCGSTIRRAFDS